MVNSHQPKRRCMSKAALMLLAGEMPTFRDLRTEDRGKFTPKERARKNPRFFLDETGSIKMHKEQ